MAHRNSLLSKCLRSPLELFFPRYCNLCGEQLTPNEDKLCQHCLLNLPYANMTLFGENRVCRLLLPYTLQGAFALLEYTRGCDLQRLIHRFKYMPPDKRRPSMALGRKLGRMIGTTILHTINHDPHAAVDYLDSIDAIVPLPLSPKRLRQRGFNQAEQLAIGIADSLHKPVWTGLMARANTKYTQVQSAAFARKQNMDGQTGYPFSILQPERLQNKHLVLVDDIITTGSTFQASLRALHESAPDITCSVFALAVTARTYIPTNNLPVNFDV